MINKQEFEAYQEVRESGITNMFNVSGVVRYSGLSRDKVFEIMKNYDELYEKFRSKE